MLVSKFLSQFKGQPLTDEQIASGMHLCYWNAKELFEDAELLNKSGSYARAFSLAILSLEELAKVPILAETLFYRKDDTEKWEKFWESFKSHSDKQLMWSTYGTFLKKIGIDHYGDRYSSDLQPLLDKFKQLGFYVDFFKGQFIKPNDFANDNIEWLEWIFEITRNRIESFSSLHSSLDDSKGLVKVSEEIKTAFRNSKDETEFKINLRNIINKLKRERKTEPI